MHNTRRYDARSELFPPDRFGRTRSGVSRNPGSWSELGKTHAGVGQSTSLIGLPEVAFQ